MQCKSWRSQPEVSPLSHCPFIRKEKKTKKWPSPVATCVEHKRQTSSWLRRRSLQYTGWSGRKTKSGKAEKKIITPADEWDLQKETNRFRFMLVVCSWGETSCSMCVWTFKLRITQHLDISWYFSSSLWSLCVLTSVPPEPTCWIHISPWSRFKPTIFYIFYLRFKKAQSKHPVLRHCDTHWFPLNT